jgi:hypothetical protein
MGYEKIKDFLLKKSKMSGLKKLKIIMQTQN